MYARVLYGWTAPPRGAFCCLYIYICIDGPRGVIWNLVVRASFWNACFTIHSKYHEFWTILSASILTFSCGSNGMGPNILFSAICEVRGGSIFEEVCFLEIKEYALNTSLKKRVFPIEIVKIDLGMIFSYVFNYCCHIIYSFYLIYMNYIFFFIFDMFFLLFF